MDQKRATFQGLIIAAAIAASGCSIAVVVGSGSAAVESTRPGIVTSTEVESEEVDKSTTNIEP